MSSEFFIAPFKQTKAVRRWSRILISIYWWEVIFPYILVFAFFVSLLLFNATANHPVLIIKPTRCTNFSNLHVFLEWNSTRFEQFCRSSSGVFHCKHSNVMSDKYADSSQAARKTVWHIPLLCVQWKTPVDGQRNCPKYVGFHSKKKFKKLIYLVAFIIRNLARCTVTWTSN